MCGSASGTPATFDAVTRHTKVGRVSSYAPVPTPTRNYTRTACLHQVGGAHPVGREQLEHPTPCDVTALGGKGEFRPIAAVVTDINFIMAQHRIRCVCSTPRCQQTTPLNQRRGTNATLLLLLRITSTSACTSPSACACPCTSTSLYITARRADTGMCHHGHALHLLAGPHACLCHFLQRLLALQDLKGAPEAHVRTLRLMHREHEAQHQRDRGDAEPDVHRVEEHGRGDAPGKDAGHGGVRSNGSAVVRHDVTALGFVPEHREHGRREAGHLLLAALAVQHAQRRHHQHRDDAAPGHGEALERDVALTEHANQQPRHCHQRQEDHGCNTPRFAQVESVRGPPHADSHGSQQQHIPAHATHTA